MWLRPDVPGTAPAYAARPVDLADLGSGWRPLASSEDPGAAVSVAVRGATLWATRLAPGVSRSLPVGALLHVFLATGEIGAADGRPLAEGDALRLRRDRAPADRRPSGRGPGLGDDTVTTLRVALAQIAADDDPAANLDQVEARVGEAAEAGAALFSFRKPRCAGSDRACAAWPSRWTVRGLPGCTELARASR